MLKDILIQFLIFLILSSGPFFLCAAFKKSFESTIALSLMSLTLMLFIFGVFGILKAGVIFAVIFSIILYAFSIYQICSKKHFSEISKKFFTPGFFVFVVSFFALTVLNYDRPLIGWDEFSHWGDIVKAMTFIDEFGTSPNSGALFKSYPPGMSLFQYFIQRITLFIAPELVFCEWRLFFSYQIFFVSFLIQFLEGFSFKQVPSLLLSTVAILLAPMAFFSETYAEIYIDPFIGIISGAGLALIFSHKKHDSFYIATTLMNIALLVLAKDAGMFFALFLLIAFLCDIYIRSIQSSSDMNFKKIITSNISVTIAAVCAFILPKLLWTANINANSADVKFSGKIELSVLFDVIFGSCTGYQSEVWKNFWNSFWSYSFRFGTFAVPVPYFLMMLVLIAAVFGIFYYLFRHNASRKPYVLLAVLTVAAQFVVYTFGLCVIFMFKFSESEAVQLASWSRYMSIVYLSCWMFVIILITDILRRVKINVKALSVFLLCLILIFIPMRRAASFATRSGIGYAQATRQNYQPLIDKTFEIIGDNDASIMVISQGSTGFDFMLMHYALRPYDVNGNWSIGTPAYEGDIWTVAATAEEWQQTLTNHYDYVVIYRINDCFAEQFSSVFNNPEEIFDNAVYRVLNNGTLELCSAL